MGRTLEVLAGRLRKAAAAESVPPACPVPRRRPRTGPRRAGPRPADPDDLPATTTPSARGGRRPRGPKPRRVRPPSPQLRPPESRPGARGPGRRVPLLPAATRPVAPAPATELIAYHRPDHPAARQYRRSPTGSRASTRPAARRCSCSPASARTAGTATVANLAVTRAADGFGRVLVIEAERPRFGRGALWRCAGAGLRELLARTVPLSMALHRTGVDGVYLLPSGRSTIGTDEAARLPALLDQLRARFEWVLVDAPVWGTHPLTHWVQASDGVYLVLRPDEWDSSQADMAHEGIARAGGKLRGCVTDRNEPPAAAAADARPVSERSLRPGRGG